MAKIIVLGSSAEFPLPRTKSNKFEDYLDIIGYQRRFELHDDLLCSSAKKGGKDKRTRSSLALVVGGKVILFDAGPDIKHQLKKYHLKPTVVFITHEHPDANYGLWYLRNVTVFSEKEGNVVLNQPIKILGVEILPFRVIHSRIAPYTGYLIKIPVSKSPRRSPPSQTLRGRQKSKIKKVAYITDMSSTRNIRKYVEDCDILFADGSILKRNLGGHLSITNQLKVYKKWRLKKVIFTHIGHDTLPHKDLVKYIKGRYKNADVAYDGMVISF
jgi:ribonuclease BN (tRNA processing enzyme)